MRRLTAPRRRWCFLLLFSFRSLIGHFKFQPQIIIFQQSIQPWFNLSFLQWLKHVPKISYLSRWRCRPTFPSRTWRRRRGTTWTRSWRSCRWLWRVEAGPVGGTSLRIPASQTTSNTSSNYSPPSPYLWAPRLSHLRLLYAIITLQTQQDLLLLFGKVGKGKKIEVFIRTIFVLSLDCLDWHFRSFEQ